MPSTAYPDKPVRFYQTLKRYGKRTVPLKGFIAHFMVSFLDHFFLHVLLRQLTKRTLWPRKVAHLVPDRARLLRADQAPTLDGVVARVSTRRNHTRARAHEFVSPRPRLDLAPTLFFFCASVIIPASRARKLSPICFIFRVDDHCVN